MAIEKEVEKAKESLNEDSDVFLKLGNDMEEEERREEEIYSQIKYEADMNKQMNYYLSPSTSLSQASAERLRLFNLNNQKPTCSDDNPLHNETDIQPNEEELTMEQFLHELQREDDIIIISSDED